MRSRLIESSTANTAFPIYFQLKSNTKAHPRHPFWNLVVSWRRSLSVPCQASDTSTLESCHLWGTSTSRLVQKYISALTSTLVVCQVWDSTTPARRFTCLSSASCSLWWHWHRPRVKGLPPSPSEPGAAPLVKRPRRHNCVCLHFWPPTPFHPHSLYPISNRHFSRLFPSNWRN